MGKRPVAADQLMAACGKGLGRFLPHHQLERVAGLIGAYTVKFFTAAHLRAALAAGFGAGGGQWWWIGFRRGVDPDLAGRAPQGPDPKRPQWVAGEHRHRRQHMLAALGGDKA